MRLLHIFLGLFIIALISKAQEIKVDKPPTGPTTCPVPAHCEYLSFYWLKTRTLRLFKIFPSLLT